MKVTSLELGVRKGLNEGDLTDRSALGGLSWLNALMIFMTFHANCFLSPASGEGFGIEALSPCTF